MVSPRRYVPSLKEDSYKQDPDTANKAISRAWLSFSASGDVTAPVVYANSGNPEDYDRLRGAVGQGVSEGDAGTATVPAGGT